MARYIKFPVTMFNVAFFSTVLCAENNSEQVRNRTQRSKVYYAEKFQDICEKKQFAAFKTINGYSVELFRKFGGRYEVNHSFLMAHGSTPSEYAFGGSYKNGNSLIKTQVTFGTSADLTFRTQVDAITLGLITKFDSKEDSLELDGGYEGEDWNAQVKFGINFPLQLSYFQNLSPNVRLGAAYSSVKGVALEGCVTHEDIDILGSIGSKLLQLTYINNISSKVKFESRLDFDMETKESKVLLGSLFDFYKHKVLTSINNKGTIKTNAETDISNNVKLILSAELQSLTSHVQVGIGLKIF